MAKRKRRSRRRLPWPRLGDPIERISALGPEGAEADAKRVQYRRMLRLKEHYTIEGERGWKPWYELALAIASEFDEGLKIVDYTEPRHKTTARWRGAEGLKLLEEVAALKETSRLPNDSARLQHIKRNQGCYRDLSIEKLVRGFREARRHFNGARNTKL